MVESGRRYNQGLMTHALYPNSAIGTVAFSGDAAEADGRLNIPSTSSASGFLRPSSLSARHPSPVNIAAHLTASHFRLAFVGGMLYRMGHEKQSLAPAQRRVPHDLR